MTVGSDAFARYVEHTKPDWSYAGKPKPVWADLPARIQAAWESAASVVAGETFDGPKLLVLGQDAVIASGDATPTTDDGTDFGTTTHTDSFLLINIGDQDLVVTTPTVTDAAFAITADPAGTIHPGAVAALHVHFDSAAVPTGAHPDTLTIGSNDAAAPYTFAITGVSA